MPRTISDYRSSLAADNGGVDPYADLSDQQFAARLHQKHYSDLPFENFAQRVGLAGDFASPGPKTRPLTNPENNEKNRLTIDGRTNRTQMAMDQAIDVAQPRTPLDEVYGDYPGLSKYGFQFKDSLDGDPTGRKLEFYPPGESHSTFADKSRPGIERFDPSMGKSDVFGEMLHHLPNVDPTVGQLRKDFQATISPAQQEDWLRGDYEQQINNGVFGDRPPSFDQWIERQGGDAFFRGYLTGQYPTGAYTMAQRRLMTQLNQYLKTKPPGSEPLLLPREPKIAGAFRDQATRDTDAAFEKALGRLPSIVPAAGLQVEQAGYGATRAGAEHLASTESAAADQYAQGNLQPANPQGERRFMSSSDIARDLAARAGPGASERAFQAELVAGRMGRREKQAAAEAQALEPSDAGPIESAVRSGLTSTLVTAPIVTLGALIPGGEVPALVALGGMTGAQRYGELRAAGVDETSAAIGAGLLGSLEGVTEKFGIGALAKKTPILHKIVEFIGQDIFGENATSLAQLADDYHQQLRDDVTVDDVLKSIKETTMATLVGGAAQLSISQILEQGLDLANRRAGSREPKIVPPNIDIVPPTLTDEVSSVEEHPPENVEDVTIEGDNEQLPGEIRVDETPGEEVTLETDPVQEWVTDQDALAEDPELADVTYEEPPVPGAPGTLPVKPTMAQRRELAKAKRESIDSAITEETKPNDITYVRQPDQKYKGFSGHGVAIGGQVRAYYDNEVSAREEVETLRKERAQARLNTQANEAASSPTNNRTETWPQIEANNRKLGHIRVNGLDVSIENPVGSIRRSKPDASMKWQRKMKDHYGYIRGALDNTGEHVDVFVNENPAVAEQPGEERIYVIDQVIDGKFDEPKVMMGYANEQAATAAYQRNYQKGWTGLGDITPMSVGEFKKWLRTGGPKGPTHWKPDRQSRAQIEAEPVVTAEDQRLAQALDEAPEDLSEKDIAALETRLEQLSKQLEQHTKTKNEAPIPTGPGIQSDEPMFERMREAPIVQFRKDAAEIEARLPPPKKGTTRLWRGNRPGEVGKNPSFTNSLPGIALPFRKAYGGDLSYIDVPTNDLSKYVSTGAVAPGAEFVLPAEVAAKAAVVDAPMAERTRGQGDLFGDVLDVKSALKKLEAEKNRRRSAGQQKPVEDKPMRRRSGPKPGSLTARSVRDEVNRILREFKTRPRLLVVQSADQLPADLKAAIARRGGLPDARAIQWNGGIYFIADQYTDIADVVDSVIHETLVHYGLRAVLDRKTHDEIINGVIRDQPMAVRRQGAQEFGDAWDWNNEEMRRIAAEELLAYYAPHYFKNKTAPEKLKPWLDRLIEAIRAFVDRLMKTNQTSDRESLKLPRRYNERGIQTVLDALEMYLKEGVSPQFVDSHDAMAEQRTIEVDRKRYPITNASGTLVAETPEQQRNFWRWFSGSKLVDARGRPLMVSHQTWNDFQVFDRMYAAKAMGRNPEAIERVGSWFTDHTDKKLYGGKNMDVYLNIQAPLEYDSFEEFQAQVTKEGGASGFRKWLDNSIYDGIHLKDAKVDGVIQNIWIALEPNQIKSATSNRGTFDPRSDDILAERRRPVFYSALTRAVEESKTVRAPAVQWLATLRNAPGVKTEEIEWSGVAEWLQSLGRPATREQLADFLRANEIRVEETVKGEVSTNASRQGHDQTVVELTALGYFPDAFDMDSDIAVETEAGDRWFYNERANVWSGANDEVKPFDGLPQPVKDLMNRLAQIRLAMRDVDTEYSEETGDQLQYAQYTLPGGENYRELLLRLPQRAPAYPQASAVKINGEDYDTWRVTVTRPDNTTAVYNLDPEMSEQEAVETGLQMDRKHDVPRGTAATYSSGHWSEPNIVAHVRFNERTDADGKRVLFVEEIQSDWHQAGRKRGYKGKDGPIFAGAARLNSLQEKFRLSGLSAAEETELHKLHKAISRWDARLDKLVPDAPFKTSWPELAFKRVIRWAAENNFDRIAWTSGEQQNERYSLEKHIARITLHDNSSGGVGPATMDGPFDSGMLFAYGHTGKEVLNRPVESADEIAEYIGEEMAERLLAARPAARRIAGIESRVRELSDLDLKTGGEGMRGFYDDILPKAVNKLVKKWGAKVETVEVSALAPDPMSSGMKIMTPVHSVPVTPEMRDAALEGLPMFQRASGSSVMLRTVPKKSGEASGYAKLANRVIDVWNQKIGHKYGPLGNLPEMRKYKIERYLALGGLTQVRIISRGIFTSLSSASPADSERVYAYLTTAGASPDAIESEPVRNAAIGAKSTIDEQGQALVEAGLLSEESYEAYRDQYLPRLYLRHLLKDEARGKMMGSGKKLSDMGYLKQRKDIPLEVRQVILGEITDPAFLAAFGVSRTMRDLTIMNFLQTISQNRAWTPENMMIEWDGRNVSPYWLRSEAAQLRRQADHIKNATIAGKARNIADRMDTLANSTLEALGATDLSDFKQIPDSARYGALRGTWVRREIHEDLVGAYQFIQTDSLLENIFGQGGFLTKATQAWKTSKVAMNVPSHIRNMMGNAMMLHLSGMPMARLPDRLVAAAISVIKQDEWYQIAKKYGLKEATFANTELYRIRDEWLLLQKSTQPTANVLHAMFAKITTTVGDVYQFEEALFKIAKLRDAMEREGLGEADAMIESHKWIFDYSLVPRWVRYLRNAPFGVPFLSYAYFSLPRLAEVAVKRPWKFLPYIGVVGAIHLSIMAMYGADGDDLEKLRNAFPGWMRSRGGMMLMPWKDQGGRWQVVDMGYTVPWGQIADVISQVGEGNIRQSMETMGLFSGPLPDLIAAWQTNRDPFTDREIANSGDPKWKQALAIMNYAWGMAMPGFITDKGALGKIKDAHGIRFFAEWDKPISFGAPIVDPRTGEPTLTKTQAWLRLFGVSVYPVDPDVTRQRNLRSMKFEIDETRKRLSEQMRDRNLTEEQRQQIADVYREEIKLRQERLQKYQEESQIPDNLRGEGQDLIERVRQWLDGKSKGETVRALKDAGYPALAALFSELPASPRPAVREALAEARA